MNRKVYMSRTPYKDCKKMVDIRPISRLDSVGEKGVFVRVPYNNGTKRGYACHLVNGDGLRLEMRMRPADFSIPGTFRDGDMEIPEIGLEIYEWARKSRGISVFGVDQYLIYERHLAQVPSTPAGLRDAANAFVQDVLKMYPEIAVRVKDYQSRLMAEALAICKKYGKD